MNTKEMTAESRISLLEKEVHELKAELARSYELHRKTTSDLEELLKATFSILEKGNFTATARKIFDAGASVIGANAGYVALLSETGEENELLFLEDGGMECTVDHNLPMPVRGLRAESYRTGKVVYDNDFMQSEWVKYMPPGHLDLPNVLFAPLNVEGKTVGIMGFSNKEGDFTEEDAMLAEAFGEYAAIALQNSRYIEEIENQTRKLDELNATKDKFFSIIAHDLKNPFISIIGLSELLREEYREKDYSNIDQFLSVIHDSALHSYDLLRNLLEWAQAQTGRISFTPQTLNLHDLVQRAASSLGLNMTEKGLSLHLQVGQDTEITADERMFETVFRNLISNAVKYSRPGGRIIVTASPHVEEMKISVSDTGIGIDPKDMPRLFREDEKFSTPGLNNEKGTGLGLILCREFVTRHGGTIRAESTPGQGSTFTVCIPRQPSAIQPG